MKLIIEDDEGRRTVVPVARPEVTIGRDEGNTIRLTERNVSRKHARIVRVNGHVEVEDLRSANGIRVNGERITGTAEVTERDLIQIGDYDLSVEEIALNVVPPALSSAPTLELQAINPATAVTAELPAVSAPPLPASSAILADLSEIPSSPEAMPPSLRRGPDTSVIHLAAVEAAHHHRQVMELGPDQMPQLRVLNTPFSGQVFLCKRSEVSIGRTDDNDVALDHRSLSRLHAKLILDPSGEWRVLDMQSANGILVNGEGYTQATLSYGDTLELGHVKLRFEGPGGDLSAVRFTSRRRPLLLVAALTLVLLGGVLLALRSSRGVVQAATVALPTPPQSVARLPPPSPTPHVTTGTATVVATPHPSPAPLGTASISTAPALPVPPIEVEPTPHELAERLYDEGRTLHQKQRYRDAEAAFKRCLGVDPTYARCHMMLGSVYASLKDMEHGAQQYRKFVELSPQDPHAEKVRELLKKYDESVAKPAPR